MAFTYAGTLDSNLERVRFYLQDTVSAAGPKPNGGNFLDTEIEGLIATEGTWQRAVAAGYETLAALWAPSVDFTADGLTLHRSQVSQAFTKLAEKWRQDYGRASGAGSRPITRVDGYSNDIDNQRTWRDRVG